jgi:MmyB-like transcription regulator ligand binding domain
MNRNARVVAEFRADFNRGPDDRAMSELVDRLVKQSSLFAEFWHSQDVRNREGGTRWYTHPGQGSVRFRQTTVMFAERPAVKLVCLAPVVEDYCDSQ